MKNPFGKKSNAFDNIKPKGQLLIPQVGTQFKAKDVAILRECLASLHKRTPPITQKKIHDALLWFASSIKGYCQCEDKVFIENENRFACLNCGTRHKSKDGGPKLASSES